MIAGLITLVLAVLSLWWINAAVLPISAWLAMPGFAMVAVGSGGAWYIISEWIEDD